MKESTCRCLSEMNIVLLICFDILTIAYCVAFTVKCSNIIFCCQ